MFKLIAEQKSLPLRHMRYCCRLIKEIGGVGNVVVTGIRKSESKAREGRNEVQFSCVKGEDKIVLCPILDWKNNDVWSFVRGNIGYYCELYDMGFIELDVFCVPMRLIIFI